MIDHIIIWLTLVGILGAVLFVGLLLSASLANIAAVLQEGTVKVRDVDRAKVYAEHLGEKLR